MVAGLPDVIFRFWMQQNTGTYGNTGTQAQAG